MSHPVIREPSNEDRQLKIVYKQVDTLTLVFVNTDNTKCVSRTPRQIKLEYLHLGVFNLIEPILNVTRSENGFWSP